MALYNPISQHDAAHDDTILSPVDSLSNYSRSLPPDDEGDDVQYSPGLFLATPNSGGMQDSVTSQSTRGAYDMIEDRDYQGSPAKEKEENELHVERKRGHERDSSQITMMAPEPTQAIPEQGIRSMRSASLHSASVDLRHPTPDTGSMVGNVEQLERTAERLSMTSDMGLEIQKMHLEQKRSDSRRSSLLTSPELPAKTFASNSIVEVNNAARSGGFSPGGFMISPRSSLSNRGRSASKGSRYSSRPEPEQEGRPLDSFVNSLPTLSPVDSRASSFAEGAEMSTMARALAGANVTSNPMPSATQKGQANSQAGFDDSERPATSASQSTIEQAQKMFQDFDGVHSHHFVSRSRATSGSAVGGSEDGVNTSMSIPQSLRMYGAFPGFNDVSGQEVSGLDARISAPTNTSRTQSYLDPKTGQPMVYYPAPVPAVLNLPQKLSNKTSAISRDKRSSQALSNVPEAAQESVISLPTFAFEKDKDSAAQPNGDLEKPKNVAQQKRASVGTRRTTQDFSVSPPPQMRAIAFFNHPGIDKRIPQRASNMDKRRESAGASLDNILDASVSAPVGAFIDHAYAGPVGSEVYGKEKQMKSSDSTEEKDKKRRSSFGQWLARASGLEYDYNTITTDLSTIDIQKAKTREKEKERLIERRRSVMELSQVGKLQPGEEENYETTPLHPVFGANGDEEGQFNDEQYLGPPTTLLAELQLRKQQAKQRTKPLTSVYPNGIHSTLLELDTVAEAEKKARERKRINLAWEGSNANGNDEDDEDVPLGILYPGQQVSQPRRRAPVGLLERRDLEDNEPLSRRRDRLRPSAQGTRSSSMLDLPLPGEDKNRESFLATSRPVSGDFASELMNQFGGDLSGDNSQSKDKGKGKAIETDGPVPEEEETLAQRKKRLRAEREAREAEVGPGLGLRSVTMSGAVPNTAAAQEQRPQLRQRRSMADILSAHPAAGRQSPGPQLVAKRTSSYSLGGGLLGLHDQEAKRRSSALSIDMMKSGPKAQGTQKQANRASSMTMMAQPNMGMGMMPGMMPQAGYGYNPNMPQFVSPTMGMGMGMGYGNMNMNLLQQQQQYMMMQGYGMGMMMPMQMGYGQMGMGGQMNGMGMGMGMQQMPPLSQGQRDMVERWRESVMQ